MNRELITALCLTIDKQALDKEAVDWDEAWGTAVNNWGKFTEKVKDIYREHPDAAGTGTGAGLALLLYGLTTPKGEHKLTGVAGSAGIGGVIGYLLGNSDNLPKPDAPSTTSEKGMKTPVGRFFQGMDEEAQAVAESMAQDGKAEAATITGKNINEALQTESGKTGALLGITALLTKYSPLKFGPAAAVTGAGLKGYAAGADIMEGMKNPDGSNLMDSVMKSDTVEGNLNDLVKAPFTNKAFRSKYTANMDELARQRFGDVSLGVLPRVVKHPGTAAWLTNTLGNVGLAAKTAYKANPMHWKKLYDKSKILEGDFNIQQLLKEHIQKGELDKARQIFEGRHLTTFKDNTFDELVNKYK